MRILVRGYREPHEHGTPTEVLADRIGGTNLGNLVFTDVAYRMLATSSNTLTTLDFTEAQRRPAEVAARINAEHDHVVLPFANIFRVPAIQMVQQLTEVIRRIEVPVTVLGIGAQSDLGYTFEPLAPVDEVARGLVAAVLDRGPSIGVRGEFTASYLQHLGFTDVDVIGCPSVFMFGTHLPATRPVDHLDADSHVVIGLTPHVDHGPLVDDYLRRFPRLEHMAQTRLDLRVLLRRESGPDDGLGYPSSPDHPLVAGGHTRIFVDVTTWLDHLADVDLSVSSRIHGTIMAALAGAPAHLLAHDSRTRELGEFLGLPFTVAGPGGPADLEPEAVLARTDMSGFHGGHARRVAGVSAYLDRHRLEHLFTPGAEMLDVEARERALPLAPPVTRLAEPHEVGPPPPWMVRQRRRAERAARSPGTE